MNTPFPFELLLAFAVMGACMWAGAFLRARVPFFRKYMVPSSLLGGIIGLVCFNAGLLPVNSEMFQALAYHLFIISFIAIGLSSAEKVSDQNTARQVFKGAGWMAIINTFSMSTQILLGLLLCALLGLLGYNLHPKFGYLVSLGFTQGPGQALTFGRLWQTEAGFTHGVDMALAFKFMGFFFAFLGVPLANWGIRKGYSSIGGGEIPDHTLRGLHREGDQMEVAGRLPMHSGNVDSLAFQFAAVGIVYGLTYLLYYALSKFLADISTLWGFFFAVALVMAFLLKVLMTKLKVFYLIDQGLQRRISGWSVDYLVVATLIPISLPVVKEYLVPLMLISSVAGLWTFAFGFYFGRRVSPLGFERMLVMYGVNTGTMANGLLLARIVDPEFRTTVSMECGSFVMLSFPGITACFLLMTNAEVWGLGFWQVIGIFAALSALCLVLLKALNMWKKAKPNGSF